MTTIVVHGTLAKGSTWYWDSWGPGGFCRALADGMAEQGEPHDIWRVKNRPVSEYPALNPETKWHPMSGAREVLQTVDGRYEWTGTPEGIARGAAAIWLARYLNALRSVTDEPIRIVAHSHGCNVVKLATSLEELSDEVYIDRAVFLACPHFWEEDYQFAQPQTWQERLDISRQMKPERVGKKFRYRASVERFGDILNIYSERDPVQLELAEKLSGSYAPQTGGFLENLRKIFGNPDIYERPHGARIDEDPRATGLYENLMLPVEKSCSGVAVHSVLHGVVVGKAIGRWLCCSKTMAELFALHGEWPDVKCSDTGA